MIIQFLDFILSLFLSFLLFIPYRYLSQKLGFNNVKKNESLIIYLVHTIFATLYAVAVSTNGGDSYLFYEIGKGIIESPFLARYSFLGTSFIIIISRVKSFLELTKERNKSYPCNKFELTKNIIKKA